MVAVHRGSQGILDCQIREGSKIAILSKFVNVYLEPFCQAIEHPRY